jgi:hypothetical protein
MARKSANSQPVVPFEKLFGRVEDMAMVRKASDEACAALPRPLFYGAAYPLKDTGAGKVVLLYPYLAQYFNGKFPIHQQTIGDCVSQGWGLGIDILKTIEIHVAGEAEEFPGEDATEIIYAGSRVEIGRGACGYADGAIGSWAAQFVTRYGTLKRAKYGPLDLTEYNGETARTLGAPNAGVPDPLEPQCREHPVKTTSLVRSYNEARDSIANGYPVPACSGIGFDGQPRRDSDGFLRRNGTWQHCMLFAAVDDDYKRPGLLCINSWGPNWVTGPKRHDQPEGSFWVDADTVDIMLREGDSFAISGYLGYPAQELEYMLI